MTFKYVSKRCPGLISDGDRKQLSSEFDHIMCVCLSQHVAEATEKMKIHPDNSIFSFTRSWEHFRLIQPSVFDICGKFGFLTTFYKPFGFQPKASPKRTRASQDIKFRAFLQKNSEKSTNVILNFFLSHWYFLQEQRGPQRKEPNVASGEFPHNPLRARVFTYAYMHHKAGVYPRSKLKRTIRTSFKSITIPLLFKKENAIKEIS